MGAGVAVLASGGLQAFTPFDVAQTRRTLASGTPVTPTERPGDTLQLGVLSNAAVPNTPTMVPSPTLEPAVSVAETNTPTPTAEEAWAGVQPGLESAWGNDTQRTVALLDGFVARFPNYAPARDKLYAALIASGVELAAAGETAASAGRFAQAQTLLPARGEAAATARALTPTPSPTPPPRAPDPPPTAGQPDQRAVVVPARPRPAPPPPPVLAPPAVLVPPPTPTKQPFNPPGR